METSSKGADDIRCIMGAMVTVFGFFMCNVVS